MKRLIRAAMACALLFASPGLAVGQSTLSSHMVTDGAVRLDARLAAIDTVDAGKQPLDSDLTAIAALATTSYGRSVLAAADAAGLRTLGGVRIGTDVQAWDGDLDLLAAMTAPATTLAGAAQKSANLSDLASASTARLNLGVVIGTNVEAWDSDLDAVAALSTTSYGRGLLTLADAAAGRTAFGLAAVAASGSASDLGAGTLPAARLPNPSSTTLGGVQSAAAVSHQFVTSISTLGVPVLAQPAAGDVSGLAASATTDTTNGSNISSGTIAAARGGAGTVTGALKGNGAGVVSQAACADLSNSASGCSTAVSAMATATTSANVAAALSDETGTGAVVLADSPTFTTKVLVPDGAVGTPSVAFGASTATGIWTPLAGAIAFGSSGEAFRSEGALGLGMKSGALLWWTGSSTLGTFSSRDVVLRRAGAANIAFGNADAAAPVAQTESVQNVVAGTTNTAGANRIIAGSQGTGTGCGGSIILQVAPAGSTGSTQNALATAVTIDCTKATTFAGNAIIPAANGYVVGPATSAGAEFGVTAGVHAGVFKGDGSSVTDFQASAYYAEGSGVNGYYAAGSGGLFGWSSGTNPFSTAFDTALSRVSAGVVAVGNGGAADATGTVKGMLLTPPKTFAGLAACSSGNDGLRSFITDSNTTTFAASAAGGGSSHVPVYCDGSGTPTWKVG